MKINKDDIKRRIIYRSSYRGTKEMDILMSSFVKSIINNLNENELLELERFVNLSDEDLFVNYGFVDVQSSRTNFVEFSGEDFLRAASEIGFQMHAKAEDDDISFIDPKAALLRVDSVVGVLRHY